MAVDLSDAEAQCFLQMAQGVVNRMAGNSAHCKTWCVTLVAAILVLAVDKSKPGIPHVAWLPVALFLSLDAYYLSLERDFILLYSRFVRRPCKLRLFRLRPPSGFWYRMCQTMRATASPSVGPFYAVLGAAVFVVGRAIG